MRLTERLDVKLQGKVLAIGQVLAEASQSRHVHPRTSSANPDAMASAVDGVLKLVRESPARKLFGIKQNFVDGDDAVRLKAIAFVAWQMVADTGTTTYVEHIARALVDGRGEPCQQIILIRHLLGQMVAENLLFMSRSEGNQWTGRLTLPRSTFAWLNGGSQSKADFDQRKLDLNRLRRGGERDGDSGQSDDPPTEPLRIPSARQLLNDLRKTIMGIEPQIRCLAARIILHITRADMIARGVRDTGVGNQVILITGPSGSGKTYAVEEMARVCGLPFASFDASTITGAGWAGGQVEDAIKELVANANTSRDAERGICFYDEADKVLKAGSAEHRFSVQGELLRPLGGSRIIVGGKRSQDVRPFAFDCRCTCFVLAGVFDGLDEIVRRRLGCDGIGFQPVKEERESVHIREALKDYGVIDELSNRISCVIQFPCPTAKSIATAVAAEHGILNGFNQILTARDVVLFPSDTAIRAIADYSIQSKGYYRAAKDVLASIVEELLFDDYRGTMVIEKYAVRRAIDRLSSGIVSPDQVVNAGRPIGGNGVASAEVDLHAVAEREAMGE
jgi:ATP-dependent Clp protease ATP-binding subunit ClpX